jgi:hypothetical protein
MADRISGVAGTERTVSLAMRPVPVAILVAGEHIPILAVSGIPDARQDPAWLTSGVSHRIRSREEPVGYRHRRAFCKSSAQIQLRQLDLVRPCSRGRSAACHAIAPPADRCLALCFRRSFLWRQQFRRLDHFGIRSGISAETSRALCFLPAFRKPLRQ